jgi:ParB-like chromosome segregation protein Spo0J
MTRYQLLPPLTADEYEALRESIETFGVLHPVVVDEHGAIIDGHHRARVCAELGITYPTVVLPGLTDEQKIEQALVLNLARRHLSSDDKRALVAELRSRGLSVRFISEHTGIPRTTVHRYASGVPSGTPAYVTGQDGRSYRAQRPRIAPAMSRAQAEAFTEMLIAGLADVRAFMHRGAARFGITIAEAVDLVFLHWVVGLTDDLDWVAVLDDAE